MRLTVLIAVASAVLVAAAPMRHQSKEQAATATLDPRSLPASPLAMPPSSPPKPDSGKVRRGPRRKLGDEGPKELPGTDPEDADTPLPPSGTPSGTPSDTPTAKVRRRPGSDAEAGAGNNASDPTPPVPTPKVRRRPSSDSVEAGVGKNVSDPTPPVPTPKVRRSPSSDAGEEGEHGSGPVFGDPIQSPP